MNELTGVHPDLVAALERVYSAMTALGWSMRPLEGVRTLQRQQVLFMQGRTTPGAIVTHNDGTVRPSSHQVKPDGYGHAVDSVFLGPDPYLDHDPEGRAVWAAFGACCEVFGLTWGGRFKTLVDLSHVELPALPTKGLSV